MIEAIVETPGGTVRYDGDAQIDGVPGTAAPILLNFMDVVGSSCGALLPTGNLRDEIDGVEVTCMDVAMPMVIARADAFGLTGYESAAELDENRAFYARMEPIRIEAGRRMGLGDVTKSVAPKFGLLAPPREGGTIAARYFMPWSRASDDGRHRLAMPCLLRADAGNRRRGPARTGPRRSRRW